MIIFGRRRPIESPEKNVISPEQKQKIKHYVKNISERQLIESLIIATKGGNLLAFSNLTQRDSRKSHFGFMSASLTKLIANLVKAYRKRDFLAFTVETAEGIVSSGLIRFPKEDAMLLCVFSPNVQLGLALRDFDFHKTNLNTILLTDQ